MDNLQHSKAVQTWLWIGVAMIVVQVMIGGVTRLTGSGLSITKWEIVTGTIPPLNEKQWEEEFGLYKETPQYEMINDGMSLSSFKFIYFWEYFHRLWGRLLGLVFVIPFCYFLFRKQLDRVILKHSLGAVVLGGVVGLFGWIMVASGLINRPWVNAYKLMLHLGLAVILLGYMVWVTSTYSNRRDSPIPSNSRLPSNSILALMCIVFIQVLFGALMSGMKAGLFYPTWPSMNGEVIPSILFSAENWSWEAFMQYDENAFIPALVQFIHRGIAYLLYVVFGFALWRFPQDKKLWFGFGILNIQVILGIWTLIMCVGSVPVGLGVSHQVIGVVFFAFLVWMWAKERNIR